MPRDDGVRRSLIALHDKNSKLYDFLRWLCSRVPDGDNDVAACDFLDIKWSYATHSTKFTKEAFYDIVNALVNNGTLSFVEPDDRPPVITISREVVRQVIAIETTKELGASL